MDEPGPPSCQLPHLGEIGHGLSMSTPSVDDTGTSKQCSSGDLGGLDLEKMSRTLSLPTSPALCDSRGPGKLAQVLAECLILSWLRLRTDSFPHSGPTVIKPPRSVTPPLASGPTTPGRCVAQYLTMVRSAASCLAAYPGSRSQPRAIRRPLSSSSCSHTRLWATGGTRGGSDSSPPCIALELILDPCRAFEFDGVSVRQVAPCLWVDPRPLHLSPGLFPSTRLIPVDQACSRRPGAVVILVLTTRLA